MYFWATLNFEGKSRIQVKFTRKVKSFMQAKDGCNDCMVRLFCFSSLWERTSFMWEPVFCESASLVPINAAINAAINALNGPVQQITRSCCKSCCTAWFMTKTSKQVRKKVSWRQSLTTKIASYNYKNKFHVPAKITGNFLLLLAGSNFCRRSNIATESL